MFTLKQNKSHVLINKLYFNLRCYFSINNRKKKRIIPQRNILFFLLHIFKTPILRVLIILWFYSLYFKPHQKGTYQFIHLVVK